VKQKILKFLKIFNIIKAMSIEGKKIF